MREVQLREAKAGLSALVDQAVKGEAAMITRHGKPQAVLLGMAEWERLNRVPSFARLLMACPLEDEDLPPRNPSPGRELDL
jgi:antitoxin Phd